MNSQFLGFISFAFAGVAFGLLGLLLAMREHTDRGGRMFLLAVLVQAGWAAIMALGLTVVQVPDLVGSGTEALRTFAWTAFLLSLPTQDDIRRDDRLDMQRLRATGMALALGLGVVGLIVDIFGGGLRLVFTVRILAALFGLVVLEQVYRNATPGKRWSIRFLAVAMLAMLGFDLLLYSDALLYSTINLHWWTARGFANALLAPLLAIAAMHNRDWRLDISVSRRVMFHSTTLIAAVIYITLAAVGGYYVRAVGGEWGAVAQALVLFVAVTALLAFGLSARLRARLRVLISKHFFDYRYDYREEWLKLTQLLSQPSEHEADLDLGDQGLGERALRGLAGLVDSAGAGLWMNDGTLYAFRAGIDYDGPTFEISARHPLVSYLRQRQWVIDIGEFTESPDHYPGLELPEELRRPQSWLIVPLLLREELVGIALLDRSMAPMPVNWEVRDLLKTAGRQIASYLGVQHATEQLVQAQQFDSFNRLSAFVVHDLKNLVSQLSLLTENAERHRNDPNFRADMLLTVQNVLDRMRSLLLQLRAGTRPIESPMPVALLELLERVRHAKRMLRPTPVLDAAPGMRHVKVRAHADRLERVIGHLVQNAVEACSARGSVIVRAGIEADMVIVEVIDNGKGMSERFLRNRLFRPFTSSKPQGMGIGTFESREYIREIGGRLDVQSQSGIGTTFRIALPKAAELEEEPHAMEHR
ncbi:MAG: PEP-CTERM system histidine kinase PrsK [Burkholderiaceae bacterium]